MLTMNLTDDRASSKYQLINQILCARKLEKDPEVKEKAFTVSPAGTVRQ